MRYLWGFFFLFISQNSFGQTNEVSVNLGAKKVGGGSANIVSDNSLTVVIFMTPECPISQKYMQRIQEIKDDFEVYKVRFFGIIPGNVPVDQIKTFRAEYNSSLTFLTDPKQKLVKIFDAYVTPEVFVVDPEGIVQYSGAIDNWYYELGRYRAEVSEYYLSDALSSLLGGGTASPKRTEAIGCFIQRK